MAALMKLIPTWHILFGSDYPFVPIASTVGDLSGLGLAAADLQGIERGNAQILLPRWRGKP